MKFLVLWHFENTQLTPEIVSAVLEQPKYGKKLEAQGKLECRYHVVGSHGGAWIYKVDSNEELDRLLAMSPVYNFVPTKCCHWPKCLTRPRLLANETSG